LIDSGLVAAFEEMAKHLRGEIELEAHDISGAAITPAQIKAIRLKVASSTKEFERLFGIPARTMESYEQGRGKLDGAMRALLRIIDREPKVACPKKTWDFIRRIGRYDPNDEGARAQRVTFAGDVNHGARP
jgi:putative transcriptional regulator